MFIICKLEDSKMHMFLVKDVLMFIESIKVTILSCFKITCNFHCGCGSLQWSHVRILHWHVVVTCSSRCFLCIFTWQFSFVQRTSSKTQQSKCFCFKKKIIKSALQLWFYSMCFVNMRITSLFLSSPVHSHSSLGHLMANERIFLSVPVSGKTS